MVVYVYRYSALLAFSHIRKIFKRDTSAEFLFNALYHPQAHYVFLIAEIIVYTTLVGIVGFKTSIVRMGFFLLNAE